MAHIQKQVPKMGEIEKRRKKGVGEGAQEERNIAFLWFLVWKAMGVKL